MSLTPSTFTRSCPAAETRFFFRLICSAVSYHSRLVQIASAWSNLPASTSSSTSRITPRTSPICGDLNSFKSRLTNASINFFAVRNRFCGSIAIAFSMIAANAGFCFRIVASRLSMSSSEPDWGLNEPVSIASRSKPTAYKSAVGFD